MCNDKLHTRRNPNYRGQWSMENIELVYQHVEHQSSKPSQGTVNWIFCLSWELISLPNSLTLHKQPGQWQHCVETISMSGKRSIKVTISTGDCFHVRKSRAGASTLKPWNYHDHWLVADIS